MKKQYVILLSVVVALMAALFLAACSQPASTSAASASADAAASAVEEASADAEAEAGAEAETAAAAADSGEFKSLPAFQPADHEGRTSDMCPTCHLEGAGGAAAIPEDHFADGELVSERLQCVTCHLIEPA